RGRFLKRALHRQEQNGKQVLRHQYSERDAADQCIEFAFVVKDFDNNDGAAERRAYRQVQSIQIASAPAMGEKFEEKETQPPTADYLHPRRHYDGAPRPQDLLEVNLQPNHEQQENQSQLGNRSNGFAVAYPTEPNRSEQQTGPEIGNDQWLSEE